MYIQYTDKSPVNLNIPPFYEEQDKMYCHGVNLAWKQKQHLYIEFTCETGPYECVSAHEAEQRLTESVPHWDQHLTHQLNPIQPQLNGVGLAVTLETAAGHGNCLVSSEGSPVPSGLDWPGSWCGSGFRPQTQSVNQLVSLCPHQCFQLSPASSHS